MTPVGIETKTSAHGDACGTTALWGAPLSRGRVLRWEGRVHTGREERLEIYFWILNFLVLGVTVGEPWVVGEEAGQGSTG